MKSQREGPKQEMPVPYPVCRTKLGIFEGKEDTNCVADGVNNNYAVRQKRMLPGTSVLNPKK